MGTFGAHADGGRAGRGSLRFRAPGARTCDGSLRFFDSFGVRLVMVILRLDPSLHKPPEADHEQFSIRRSRDGSSDSMPCQRFGGKVRAQMPYGAHLHLPIHMAVIVLNKAIAIEALQPHHR